MFSKLINFQKKNAEIIIIVAIIYTILAGSFILKDHLDYRSQKHRLEQKLLSDNIYMEDLIDE